MSLVFTAQSGGRGQAGRKIRVLIACGGTGGHIFPGISLALALKERSEVREVILVGTTHPLERKIFAAYGLAHEAIPAAKPTSNPLKFPIFLIIFTAALLKAAWIVLKSKADVVIGFGGYASFPVCLFSAALGRRLFIHEQNCVPGLANRALSVFAGTVAVSFKDTAEFFKGKAAFVGNPIRSGLLAQEKEKALASFGLSPERFTLLVMGGSQGSRRINMLLSEAAGLLGREEIGKLQIIHIAGRYDGDALRQRYGTCGVESRVYDFVEEIGPAYRSADLAVSRAGATAIFEMAALGVPSILIPYRYAGGHQYYNARAAQKSGGAIIMDELELTPLALKEKILELRRDPGRLRAMSECARRFSVPDAARRFADLVTADLR